MALLREEEQGNKISIRLLRKGDDGTVEDFKLRDLASKIARLLQSIHQLAMNNDSPQYLLHYEELYQEVFQLYKARMMTVISQLCRIFKDKDMVDKMISMALGLMDDESRAYDNTLDDQLITLNINIKFLPPRDRCTYEDLDKILQVAQRLCRLEDGAAQKRLKSIVGASLADSVYEHLKVLKQPSSCTEALVACARACKSFAKVEFDFGMPTMESTNPRSPLNGAVAIASNQKRRYAPITTENCSKEPTRVLNPAQKFLDPEDCDTNPESLQPIAKRYAFELTLLVLEGLIPEPRSNLYYIFGFVVCKDDQAVRTLGRNYKYILTMADECGTTVFTKLWQALASDQLWRFFSVYGRSGIVSEIPNLECFLNTTIDNRSSVYRLIQFLRVKEGTYVDTDPVACGGRNLIRDYGFHMCKGREDVEVLKDVYRQAFERFDIFEIHQACVDCCLREKIGTEIVLDQRSQRLLQNQGPLPDLGYEKIVSNFKLSQGLFKKDRKKNRAAGRVW